MQLCIVAHDTHFYQPEKVTESVFQK